MSVASWMPTAAASSRWLAVGRDLSESSTSHIGREPPARAKAASNARPTSRATPASSMPIGVCVGRGTGKPYPFDV